MKKYHIPIITAFIFLIFNISCDKPYYKNRNMIFDKFAPETKEYKDELIKQLEKADKTKLTYWLESYNENDTSQSINVKIQGDSLCALIVLKITSSKKGIEGIIKNKGKGYIGAELINLKFEMEKDNTLTEFIFEEISEIKD
jgi:hypothetical protein